MKEKNKSVEEMIAEIQEDDRKKMYDGIHRDENGKLIKFKKPRNYELLTMTNRHLRTCRNREKLRKDIIFALSNSDFNIEGDVTLGVMLYHLDDVEYAREIFKEAENRVRTMVDCLLLMKNIDRHLYDYKWSDRLRKKAVELDDGKSSFHIYEKLHYISAFSKDETAYKILKMLKLKAQSFREYKTLLSIIPYGFEELLNENIELVIKFAEYKEFSLLECIEFAELIRDNEYDINYARKFYLAAFALIATEKDVERIEFSIIHHYGDEEVHTIADIYHKKMGINPEKEE